MAVIGGIAAPLGDTIRRWDTWREYPPALLDDYFIGAVFFWVVWLTRKEDTIAQVRLAATWGFATGVALMSFGAQVYGVLHDVPDPSGFPSRTVAIVKAVMVMFSLTALVLTLRSRPQITAACCN